MSSHTFTLVGTRIRCSVYFGNIELALCDFCMVDFGSRDPVYFGLPPRTRIGFDRMQFVRTGDDPRPETDKFCPSCAHRLAFLRFVDSARRRHAV